ncbi:MAG: complex I subunit 5 family protein [Rubrobacteraceae bacterium]
MILLSITVILTWVVAAILALLDGRKPWVGWFAVAGQTAGFVSLCLLAARVLANGPVEMVAGGWPEGVGITLRADALGVAFALVSCAVILASLLYEVIVGVRTRTFPALVLFLNSGLMGLFLTGDIFNFYVFVEISMTSAYILAAYREQNYQIRAAFVFAVVNLLGSVIFVVAIAGLYHLTGSLDMATVADRVKGAELASTVSVTVAIFVAFGLKIGLFPFHFWLPAVYVGSHAPVSAILAGALANIGSYGLLRFGGGILPEQSTGAALVLLLLGSASILYVALQAISRRLPAEVMAYSAIGHAGYILIAIGVGGQVGYAAAVLYAIVNSANKAVLFLATGSRGRLVGAAFAVGAFSVAGVPPAAGFLSKLVLFRAGLSVGGVPGSAVLVALIFVGGALSFIYSFQVYQKTYMMTPGVEGQEEQKPSPLAVRMLLITLAALVLLGGFWPEPLLALSDAAASVLGGSR